MSNPVPGNEQTPQRPAGEPRRDEASPERARAGGREDPDQGNDRYAFAETAFGGADAVEKTTWVVGEGTEPQAQSHADVSARTPTGGGINLTAWVIILLAALIALVYGFAVFT